MQSNIAVIPNNCNVDMILYSPTVSVMCSIGKKPFQATMEIEYNPVDKLLEFMSFETWLNTITNEEMTIEELCRLVFDTLSETLGDIRMRVTVYATTTVHAPVSATISRGE